LQEIPAKLTEKRQKVVEEFKRLQAATDPILKIFTDPEVTRQIQSSRDSKQLLEYLTKNHQFKEEMIDTCYDYAKCLFECGNYQGLKTIRGRCYDHNFRRKNWRFSQNTYVMIKILHNLALF
jgi:hypothetical protein